MKIFFFPHLVVDEIMKHFNTMERIRLSYCSKRAYSLVKMFSKMKGDLEVTPPLPFTIGRRYYLRFLGDILIHVILNKARDLNTSSLKTSHGFNKAPRWTDSTVFTYWQDVDEGCRETINHICDLFKIPVSIIHIYNNPDLWLLDFAQQRQEQPLKEVLTHITFKTSAEAYSKILSCNATERLVFNPSLPRGFQFNRTLPSVRSIFIGDGFWIEREHLLALESQNVQLLTTRFTSEDINALLRCWSDGGGLPELKSLKIHGSVYNDTIYQSLKPRLERVQGEITYQWNALESALKFNWNAFHLRREDNVVATVQANGPWFTMAVWPDLNGDCV